MSGDWSDLAIGLVILANTALTQLGQRAGRRATEAAREQLATAVGEVHTEVKSTNGQTTAQNVQNLVAQMETDHPDQPPHEPRTVPG